jgi:hypothetical protein
MQTKSIDFKINTMLKEIKNKFGYPEEYNFDGNVLAAKNLFLQMLLEKDGNFKKLIENHKYREARDYFIGHIEPFLEELPSSFFEMFSVNGKYSWRSPITMAMDVLPFLDLNIFNFSFLPAAAEVMNVFDREFALRHGSERSGKYFILDQAKKYFRLETDEEAVVFIVKILAKGKDIFKSDLLAAEKIVAQKYGSVKTFLKQY